MRKLLDRLHAKLGDLWWYSLMIFIACRAADALNAFVGLWLVPKYVDPSELGAVMPLTSFACFLALPLSIFSMAFAKEVNTLASRREFGQLKSLLKGVFITTAAALLLAIIASRILLPLFLKRIRIVEGSLGILILATAILSCSAPIFTNALQGLKRFKELSLLNLLTAPARLIAMLATIPFRALSGYFVGQCSTPVLQILTSVFCLRRDLAVPAKQYWCRSVAKRFSRIILGATGYLSCAGLTVMVEQLILRQRLPDVESAAFYMATRFSEIAAFVTGTLLLTLFPYTSELSESGKSTRPLVVKASAVTILFGAILAGIFTLFGKRLLTLLPNGNLYADYAWSIPWLIGITSVGSIWGYHANTEISANRFGFLKWWIPTSVLYVIIMFLVTGYGYFSAVLPDSVSSFLSTHNVTSLSAFLWCATVMTGIRVFFAIFDLLSQHPPQTTSQSNEEPS